MSNKKQNFKAFQNNKLSVKEAGKALGGYGTSNSTCRNLQNQLDAAVARGDFEEAQRIMRIIIKVCGYNEPF